MAYYIDEKGWTHVPPGGWLEGWPKREEDREMDKRVVCSECGEPVPYHNRHRWNGAWGCAKGKGKAQEALCEITQAIGSASVDGAVFKGQDLLEYCSPLLMVLEEYLGVAEDGMEDYVLGEDVTEQARNKRGDNQQTECSGGARTINIGHHLVGGEE